MKSLFCLFAATVLPAQVTPPAADWPTYHGSDFSQHYSTLTQLHPANVAKLNLAWTHQAHSLEKFETTPLVIDVVALDPVSGRPFWVYEHKLPDVTYPCCGKVNRGVAYANGLIYFATHDAKVLALDARTGRLRWENTLIDHRQGYSFTHAPLVVKDKVIVGSGGGELGIRGFLASMPKPAKSSGDSRSSPPPASPATKPGAAIPGNMAADPSGSPAPMTRS
jgi:alcohol dehydrogenase (cytochrome c)